MQNIFQGLPLRLLPEEVSVLLHHGIIDLIVDSHNQGQHHSATLDASITTTSGLTDQALVFDHLWKDQNFFVAPGMKFGGDYLLYRNDPLVCHASLVASVKEPDEPLSLVDMANSARLVSTVQKQHLFCSVLPTHADVTTDPSIASPLSPSSPGPNRRVVAYAVEWAGF
jgi:tRNA-intron lyase